MVKIWQSNLYIVLYKIIDSMDGLKHKGINLKITLTQTVNELEHIFLIYLLDQTDYFTF